MSEKIAMLIQLMLSTKDEFEKRILQNSKESVVLRMLMTGGNEKNE